MGLKAILDTIGKVNLVNHLISFSINATPSLKALHIYGLKRFSIASGEQD